MFNTIPPITRVLLIANGLVFLLQNLVGEFALLSFMLWPWGDYPIRYFDGQMTSVGFLPWQLLTYGFMHGDLMHLIFNMFALFMFGAVVEQTWGERRFLTYYLVCIVGAGLVQLVVVTSMVGSGPLAPTVGASGGVFGILLAFGMLFPHRRVMLLFPPIPMKAWVLVLGYGLLELFLGVTRTQSGVAHFAHLGGMLFGFLLIQYWRGKPPFAGRRVPPPDR